MDKLNPILDEIRAISPVVAAIGRQMPYKVPRGYFEQVPVQVMLKIGMAEKAGTDPSVTFSKENPYSVPEGYFNGLAASVLDRIRKQNPENPRQELEMLSPLLGNIPKKNPFASPDKYFDEFSDNVVAGIKAIDFVNEELENLSPVMNELRSKNTYQAPNAYFDQLAPSILDQVKKQAGPARLLRLVPGGKLLRYAAAAMVVGIIALAGFLISGNHTKTQTGWDAASMAKIPDQEIENFLNNNTLGFSELGTEPAIPGNSLDSLDTKDLLANISDEELQQYVELHGNGETPITN